VKFKELAYVLDILKFQTREVFVTSSMLCFKKQVGDEVVT